MRTVYTEESTQNDSGSDAVDGGRERDRSPSDVIVWSEKRYDPTTISTLISQAHRVLFGR